MNTLSTKRRQAVNRLVSLGDLLFPPACLFCRQPMPDGSACCASCLQAIRIWPQSICQRCGIELAPMMAPGPCGHCLQQPPAQHQTHSVYHYHGPVREAILEWKLQGHRAAVDWLLQTAMPGIRQQLGPDALLLPVPMPLSRMRQSGQHHAAILCRCLAEATTCAWDWRILRRVGEQPRQSALNGSARRKNLRKAFVLTPDYAQRLQVISTKLSGPIGSIWIVDDILTTGATLHFAARASLKLGLPVHVLSLARTSLRG